MCASQHRETKREKVISHQTWVELDATQFALQVKASPRQNARHLTTARKTVTNLLIGLTDGVFGQLLPCRPDLPALRFLALEMFGDGFADLRLEVQGTCW